MGTDVTGGGDLRARAAARDGLAPVIPLFGDRRGEQADARTPSTAPAPAAAAAPAPLSERPAIPASTRQGRARTREEPQEAVWRSTWDDDVVPLARRPREAQAATDVDSAGAGSGGVVGIELAEKHLLKKLRGRSLSIAEARAALIAFGANPSDADAVIEAFVSRGYLDDAAFAEQLVHIGLDRKGQGRRVIAQTLAKRGVPRDVADAALVALPDDDGERALDFARTKARSMAGLDRDTALRRLAGQLARRGYGGPVALEAARTALDDAGA